MVTGALNCPVQASSSLVVSKSMAPRSAACGVSCSPCRIQTDLWLASVALFQRTRSPQLLGYGTSLSEGQASRWLLLVQGAGQCRKVLSDALGAGGRPCPGVAFFGSFLPGPQSPVLALATWLRIPQNSSKLQNQESVSKPSGAGPGGCAACPRLSSTSLQDSETFRDSG